jgi:putative hydrolase of the HAD superfamily
MRAPDVPAITHLFFDVGGVLGSDAWDRVQRAAAVRRFGLDAAELEERHAEAVGALESGTMTMDEYLDATVFHQERPFGREEFRAFMRAQSEPHPEVLALARALAGTGEVRLMTINNESDELNRFRLRHFGLAESFSAFFSSCWLGAVKPSRRIYETALTVSQAEPGRAVFIDDRARNLGPARALGMRVILFRDVGRLRAELSALGVPA